MVRNKDSKNTTTQEETITQPPPPPHHNHTARKKWNLNLFRDFKIGVAAGITGFFLATLLTAYITNFTRGGGIHFIGGLLSSEIYKIPIASPVTDDDSLDRGQFVRGIGDKEDINTETITKEIEIKEDGALLITGNSQGEFNPGKNGKNTGRLICKIIINNLDYALDSESICACKCDPWKFPIPMGTSVQFLKVLSPGTYTVTVEATFYGCIENPRTSMQYVVLRMAPATIAQMNGMNLDEKKP